MQKQLLLRCISKLVAHLCQIIVYGDQFSIHSSNTESSKQLQPDKIVCPLEISQHSFQIISEMLFWDKLSFPPFLRSVGTQKSDMVSWKAPAAAAKEDCCESLISFSSFAVKTTQPSSSSSEGLQTLVQHQEWPLPPPKRPLQSLSSEQNHVSSGECGCHQDNGKSRDLLRLLLLPKAAPLLVLLWYYFPSELTLILAAKGAN